MKKTQDNVTLTFNLSRKQKNLTFTNPYEDTCPCPTVKSMVRAGPNHLARILWIFRLTAVTLKFVPQV